ncbi:MAG: sugar phosphate isomerase/epimerase, partial [Candidatus Bathyarchaeota archaeon]|nr:sugar phosphate isomerase/epimerase [Candidatus Bathyarchaeota archaeon]
MWTERFDEAALPLIRKAKDLGFDGVEIPLMPLEAINVGKTKRELEKNDMVGLGSVGLPLDKDLTSRNEATRRRGIEYLKRCAEVVSELGGDSINGVVYTAWGKITGKSRTEEEWRLSVAALKEACEYARDYDITFGLEPVNRFETYFLNTAADAVKLVKEVGEPN